VTCCAGWPAPGSSKARFVRALFFLAPAQTASGCAVVGRMPAPAHCVSDIEASGLGRHTCPIEVGCVREDSQA
jgi:hypothetical protein